MNDAQRICYTRNFEDVILQRVFENMPEGCYVDVGASAPVIDSNTYALYTRGWRGICIDPMRVHRCGARGLTRRDHIPHL